MAKMLYLIRKREFFPLFLTQFFGAFNDNAFKFSMLTLISYFLTTTQVQSEKYQVIASALFIAPFFLFSATAGQLADKYDKSFIIRIIKALEILLIVLGGISLYFGNIFLMMVTLTGLGIHSTFFGPVKYAILPDHLTKKELLGATALIEASTFLAILLGTTLGTLSIAGVGKGAFPSIVLIVGVAVSGFIASLFIPGTPSYNKALLDWNVFRATKNMFKDVLTNRENIPVFLGISWFWLLGGIIIIKLPDYTNYVLHAQTEVFALFLALFSIGIAVGSFIINYYLKGVISLRYVPHSMILLSFFLADLYFATPLNRQGQLQSLSNFFSDFTNARIAVDLFLLSLSCGLFLVPFYTFLQVGTDPRIRARTIASNNIINAFFMVIGTFLVMFLLYLKMTIAEVFGLLALLNLGASLGVTYLLRSNPLARR